MATAAATSKVTVSLVPKVTGEVVTQKAGEFDTLAKVIREPKGYPSKEAMPLISGCTYGDERSAKGSLKHDANVLQMHAVLADYDDGQIAIEEAADRLRAADVRAILYTSPRHTPEAPRYRIVLPLSKPYPADPSFYRGMVGRLNGLLDGKLDGASFRMSQAFYLGRVEGAPYSLEITEGRCIDDASELDGSAIGPPEREEWNGEPGTFDIVGLFAEVGQLGDELGGGRHSVTCPWAEEHTSEGGRSSSAIWDHGGFRCLHDHCADRTWQDVLERLREDHADVVDRYAAEADEARVIDAQEVFEPDPAYPAAIQLLQGAGYEIRLNGQQPAVQSADLIWDDDAEAIPKPAYLIDEVFQTGGLTVLYGPPNGGKSFLALDWALAIATGREWHGREVSDQGPVVYVAPEGAAGLGARIKAWKVHNGYVGRAGVVIRQEPVILSSPKSVADFIEIVRGHGVRPALVVLDTLAHCMAGFDENSTKDMTAAMDGIKRIRGALGCGVLTNHHTNAGQDRERGNTALRGAMDTMVKLTQSEDGTVTVRCNKQRDDEGFSDMHFYFKSVDVGKDANDKPATSAVLLRGVGTSENVADRNYIALCALHDIASDRAPMTKEEWAQALVDRTGNRYKDLRSAKAAVNKSRVPLIGAGFVSPVGDNKWQITDAGKEAYTLPNQMPD